MPDPRTATQTSSLASPRRRGLGTGSALFAHSFTRQARLRNRASLDLSRPHRHSPIANTAQSLCDMVRPRSAVAGRSGPDLPQRVGG